MFVCLCYRLKEEDDIDGDGGERTPTVGEKGETGRSLLLRDNDDDERRQSSDIG